MPAPGATSFGRAARDAASRAAPCSARTSPGVAGNAVVPAHAGDAAKVVLIRRAVPGTPVATIVTTLVMLTGVDVCSAAAR